MRSKLHSVLRIEFRANHYNVDCIDSLANEIGSQLCFIDFDECCFFLMGLGFGCAGLLFDVLGDNVSKV